MGNGSLEIPQKTVRVNLPLGRGRELPQAITSLQPGTTVLDLGSGDGAYSFLAATAVGENGFVIGVDTTPDMISQVRANVIQNGFCNVSFRLGELEYLPVADETVDAIISHYGVNQSSGKAQVFREAFRVLKPGGGLAIVDLVATQAVLEDVAEDDVLYTEFLSGVLMLDDIEDMLRAAGSKQIRSQIKPAQSGTRQASSPKQALKNIVLPALIEAIKPA